ncbi:MAG: hypothetical protein RR444_05640, partial [Oscillospiraceae bacterium]
MKKQSIRKIIAVTVAAAMLGGASTVSIQAAPSGSVTVEWNNVRQVIDGFGFTQEEECTYVMEEPYRSEVMDLLFSPEKGIGASILRTEIGCGDVAKATIEPAKGVWNTQPDPREL